MPIPLIILGALGIAGAYAIEKALGLGEQEPESKKPLNSKHNYVPPPDYDDDDKNIYDDNDYYDDDDIYDDYDDLSIEDDSDYFDDDTDDDEEDFWR